MSVFITSDGAQFECPFCGLASVGILYVDILYASLAGALEIFGNPDNTRRMEYRAGNEVTVYEWYTKLLGVEYAYNDASAVRVSLRRTYEGEVS